MSQLIRRSCRPAELTILFLLLLAGIVGLQSAVSAYSAEFVTDANSHYVSGSMIHDYLLHGLWPFQNPVHFLIDFHSHYPLVDIGHWPPLYYGIEAVWMLIFSSSRASMLMLSAAVAAFTAVLLYAGLAPRFGRAAGLFAAAAFITAPLVQAADTTLMLDVPVALFCLAAALSYACYLETVQLRYSAAFGVIAAAALMIKGNAGCLALLPPFVLLLGRRFELLRCWSFWAPVPIVIMLAGPWYLVTGGRVEAGFRFAAGWDYLIAAAGSNPPVLLHSLGLLVALLALAGLVLLCLKGRGVDAVALSAGALLLAVLIFQLIVPAALEPRYVIPAIPPALILAAYAASRLLTSVPGSRPRNAVIAFGLLALSALPQTPELKNDMDDSGIIGAAKAIWRAHIPGNPSVLIATDYQAEVQAVADLAMLDPARPSLYAIRGSRLLGGGGYNSEDYQPRFADPAEVMAEIDRYAIPLVLFRKRGDDDDWAHLDQVEAARALDPARWELIYRDAEHGPEILLFRLRGNVEQGADDAALKALSAPNALR